MQTSSGGGDGVIVSSIVFKVGCVVMATFTEEMCKKFYLGMDS